jgi:hypothetical protein
MTVARCTAPEAPASAADSAAALFKQNPAKYKPVPCIKHVSSAHELARVPQNFRLGALQYKFPKRRRINREVEHITNSHQCQSPTLCWCID